MREFTYLTPDMLSTEPQLVPACIGESIHQKSINFAQNTKKFIDKQQSAKKYLLDQRWRESEMDS